MTFGGQSGTSGRPSLPIDIVQYSIEHSLAEQQLELKSLI